MERGWSSHGLRKQLCCFEIMYCNLCTVLFRITPFRVSTRRAFIDRVLSRRFENLIVLLLAVFFFNAIKRLLSRKAQQRLRDVCKLEVTTLNFESMLLTNHSELQSVITGNNHPLRSNHFLPLSSRPLLFL